MNTHTPFHLSLIFQDQDVEPIVWKKYVPYICFGTIFKLIICFGTIFKLNVRRVFTLNFNFYLVLALSFAPPSEYQVIRLLIICV